MYDTLIIPLSADTIAASFYGLSHVTDAPWEVDGDTTLTEGVVPYTEGMEAVIRNEIPGYDSGIIALVIGTLLIVLFAMRRSGRFLSQQVKNLWSVRGRTNLFDEHTVNETGALLALVLQVCMCQAILLMCWAFDSRPYMPDNEILPVAVELTGLMLVYYMAEVVAYRLIGYVFTLPNLAAEWVKGFNATQTLLGFFLVFPTLGVIFYPAAGYALVIIGASLYLVARILFICKGFRIFYHNFLSLVYFILYLCSVEIIPLILVYFGGLSICNSILF